MSECSADVSSPDPGADPRADLGADPGAGSSPEPGSNAGTQGMDGRWSAEAG